MILDHKQKRLIEAWLGRATARDGDEYGRFMAAWLAFNAFCYARFAAIASRRRPDLGEDRGLVGLEGQVPAEGTLELRPDGRVRLLIKKPGRIQIDIRDRYTEDVVFTQFALQYQSSFRSWLEEASLREARDGFLAALKRPTGYYVINMLRAAEHDPDGSLEEMTRKTIVVAIADPNLLKELVDALYQVRCNVFHGEKVPGDLNDDRIVTAARPLLVELLQRAVSQTAQPGTGADAQ